MGTILFRTDGGEKLGFGHVMRCLALAKVLRRNYEILFLMSGSDDGMLRVSKEGFGTCMDGPGAIESLLPNRIDAIITDTREPRLSVPAGLLRSLSVLHMTITDLGLPAPPADLLIDGSISPLLYGQPPAIHVFGGASYMILDPFYWGMRNKPRANEADARNILVTLGGGAPSSLIKKVLEAVQPVSPSTRVDFVLGVRSPGMIGNLPGFCSYHVDPPDFKAMLKDADVVVTCGGTTLYQAACLGVPAIVISRDRYQNATASAFEQCGACLHLGDEEEFSPKALETSLLYLLQTGPARMRMSRAGTQLCDGQGVFRVAAILDRFLSLRRSMQGPDPATLPWGAEILHAPDCAIRF